MPPSRVTGVVLAAGAGRRLGEPKATATYKDERFVDRAVRTLRAGGVEPVLVVLGAAVTEVPEATVVPNPDWATGMASSLRVALDALEETQCEAILVTLADEVRLAREDVAAVLHTEGELVATRYENTWSHPVRIDRAHWRTLREQLKGDRGARPYLERHADELILVPATNPDGIRDLDRWVDAPGTSSS